MEGAANWLETHMLQCPSKAYFGLDCPGCGFQRACADLLRGDLAGTWEHYPPLLPFLATLLLLAFALASRYRYRLHLLMGAFVTTCVFVVVSYIVKIT